MPTCWQLAKRSSGRSPPCDACSSTGRAMAVSIDGCCAASSPRTSRRSSASSPRSMPSDLMRSVAWGVLLAALAVAAHAAPEPVIPAPQGFVTDRAGVVAPAIEGRLTRLLEELRQKTGAEIAVVTVDTTAPLDDFGYALRIADAWKPGRRKEDTGIVFLVAVRDRKIRILTGYGVEGILPDGLVGEIEDREILPAFRAGHLDDGIWRGVVALASRIAAARGVELTGVPTREQPREIALPP